MQPTRAARLFILAVALAARLAEADSYQSDLLQVSPAVDEHLQGIERPRYARAELDGLFAKLRATGDA